MNKNGRALPAAETFFLKKDAPTVNYYLTLTSEFIEFKTIIAFLLPFQIFGSRAQVEAFKPSSPLCAAFYLTNPRI
jgi:hypothetical protein